MQASARRFLQGGSGNDARHIGQAPLNIPVQKKKRKKAGTREQGKTGLAEKMSNVALEHKGWGEEGAMAALKSRTSFYLS